VSNNGQDFEGDRRTVFLYGRTTQGIRAVPSTGPVLGGTSVTVVGSGLGVSGSMRCWFGGSAVLASGVNETAVSCVCPAVSEAQVVQLAVTHSSLLPAADAALIGFRYVPVAEIERTYPSSGPEAGGTLVQVIGTGFEHGLTGCLFGTRRARIGQIVTSSLMDVHTPASSRGGTVMVRVLHTDGASQASHGGAEFSYLQAMTIERLEPSAGPEAGGTVVQVSGAGFEGKAGLLCRFGVSAQVASVVHTSTRLECTSPVHRPGNMKVTVSPNEAGDSSVLTTIGACVR